MIVIIDYGVGNLASINNMFKKLKIEAIISKNKKDICKASKLILPGVGSFDIAMKKIREEKLNQLLDEKVLVEKTPILGVCLGMHLLFSKSQEGEQEGLGWLKGEVLKFETSSKYRVPHMGWNYVSNTKNNNIFNEGLNKSRFYFVHSYYVKAKDKNIVLMKSNHGIIFDSVVGYGNIFGCQFHPEKSHKFGMQFLERFSQL